MSEAESVEEYDLERFSIGIEGLDEVLHGGLIHGRSYLARGHPGTGKTILGFHFLIDEAGYKVKDEGIAGKRFKRLHMALGSVPQIRDPDWEG